MAALALFVLVGGVWLSAAVVNARLCRLFLASLPAAAKEKPPPLGSGLRDPQFLFFFLRRSSDVVLRQDSEVWALTKALRLLVLLSIAVPPGGLFALVAFLISN